MAALLANRSAPQGIKSYQGSATEIAPPSQFAALHAEAQRCVHTVARGEETIGNNSTTSDFQKDNCRSYCVSCCYRLGTRTEREVAMEAVEFAHWLAAMDRLSPMQRAVALERLGGRPETAGPARREPIVGCASDVAGSTARTKGGDLGRTSRIERDALGAVGERKVESVGCPHCRGRDVIAWGRSHGLPRYRCKSCRRTFNAATMTPMARLRKRDRWFDQAQAMLEGVSLAKAAARCGVHASTAYRWRHRFLSAPALDKPRTLQGVVEADETFILELFKGRRSGLRASRDGGAARPCIPVPISRTFPSWSLATAPAQRSTPFCPKIRPLASRRRWGTR